MTSELSQGPGDADQEWWSTAITSVRPGHIVIRGHEIQDLIGQQDLVSVAWLLLRGSLPTYDQRRLLQAALIASVDHGPQAPSIAVARMAITCGVGVNNAMATGINVLGDVHGGAGQQCVELLQAIRQAELATGDLDEAVRTTVAQWRARDPYLPGFGHRLHRVDPRRDPLLGLTRDAQTRGTIDGHYLRIAETLERALNADGRVVPMNVDGCTAVIYAELGFPPPLARGLFVLGRSIGILAHVWEERQMGRRIKGPLPPRRDSVHRDGNSPGPTEES